MRPDEPDAPPEPAAEPAEDEETSDDPMALLEQERDQFKALAQRTQADFLNYKRRVDEERGLVGRSATGHVLARLFPLIDDLRRAVEALPEDAPASWSEGIALILQNMQALVEAEGVSAFEPAPGDGFDPAQHEALYYEPTTERPPGSIVSTVRVGYRNSDRVLRPAQVVVAREAEAESAAAVDG